MRNLFSLQGFVDLIGTLGGANDSEEISRQFAAVVKIIPLAIITSPADKEKINFRRRRRRLVDEAKGRILRQHSLEVCVAAFAAAQITERFRRANIVPKVAPMPCHESYESDKEIDRPLDAEIDVEDAVNSKKLASNFLSSSHFPLNAQGKRIIRIGVSTPSKNCGLSSRPEKNTRSGRPSICQKFSP